MLRDFLAAKPLQACKLVAIAGVLVYGLGGFFRVVPGHQLGALLVVPFVSVALALVITAETLVAGYRVARAPDSPTARLTGRPVYAVARAAEAVVGVLAAGGIVVTLTTLLDEPIPGPGAIGLLFVLVGLGLAVLVTSLLRTLVAFHCYRRDRAAGRPTTAAPDGDGLIEPPE